MIGLQQFLLLPSKLALVDCQSETYDGVMHKLSATLLNSTGLRQSLVTVVGNIFATGLSALALILISRVLGPSIFGQFSVGFAIVVMLSRVCDMGLNATILKFVGGTEDKKVISDIVHFTFRLKLFVSAVVIGAGLLCSPLLARLLHFDSPTILILSFVLSLATTWYEHVLTVLQAVHRFNYAVAINAVQSSTKLIGAIAFALFGIAGAIPFFSWYMAAPIVPILGSKQLLPRWLSLRWQHLWRAPSNAAVIAMARHAAIGFIAAGLIENIDVLFVQGYLSSYETGLLGGVSRIAMMISLIAYSLGNVLNPRVARYKDKYHLRKYMKKAVIVAAISVLGFLLFLPFARLSILLTIGQEYLPGTPILLILAAAAFLTITTIPFLALFYSFKADWYFSISGVLQLAIILGGNILFVPHYGLAAAAWTRLVARVVLFVFTTATAIWLYAKTPDNSD